MFGSLHPARRGPRRPLAFSVTLTARCTDAAEFRAALETFTRIVQRRAPEAALLLALELAPGTARPHGHGLALLPPTLDPWKLVAWWCRVWPREKRTRRDAKHAQRAAGRQRQRFRPLPVGGRDLARALDRVLVHALGTTRKRNGVRERIEGLPPLADRVTACGALAGLWARVCHSKGIPAAPYVPPARKRLSRPRKVSTAPSRPSVTWVSGESCAWCARVFRKGKRHGSRYCDRCCGSAASRALRAFESRAGNASAKAVRAYVGRLEAKGWTRRDAIQAASVALATARAKGTPLADVTARAPACKCGCALAARSNAVTCGRGACRMKLLRRRRREERRKGRVRSLFSALLRSFRHVSFNREEAMTLGTSLRVRASAVDELLRQLVEEDGTLFVVRGAPGVYRFIPPRTSRLAA
jgi:hypothetical protein